MADEREGSPLVALGQTLHELPCLILAAEGLLVGEVGATCQLAAPHQAIAEEVTVEELSARGNTECRKMNSYYFEETLPNAHPY